MRKPISISDFYYTWGSVAFTGLIALASTILMILAFTYESYLLGFAAVSAPGVAAYGDFKGTDKIAHFIKAGFVFIPILLFSGWWWILYAIGYALPIWVLFPKSTQKILYAELIIILVSVLGIILTT